MSGSSDLINQTISALIVSPVQPSALPATTAAHNAHIPLIIGDVGATGAYDAYISSDNADGGAKAAQYLAMALGSGAHKIGILGLPADNAVGQARVGKVVLVIGASIGIGAATVRRLAELGHLVVAGARRVDRLDALAAGVREAGGRIDVAALDVTSPESVRGFAADAIGRHGRIDVLVNNAGVMALSPVADLRIAEWEQMIDVNVGGVLCGIAAVLPLMRAQGGGRSGDACGGGGHEGRRHSWTPIGEGGSRPASVARERSAMIRMRKIQRSSRK